MRSLRAGETPAIRGRQFSYTFLGAGRCGWGGRSSPRRALGGCGGPDCGSARLPLDFPPEGAYHRRVRRLTAGSMPPSSSGLGYQVLILETRVRFPLGVSLAARRFRTGPQLLEKPRNSRPPRVRGFSVAPRCAPPPSKRRSRHSDRLSRLRRYATSSSAPSPPGEYDFTTCRRWRAKVRLALTRQLAACWEAMRAAPGPISA